MREGSGEGHRMGGREKGKEDAEGRKGVREKKKLRREEKGEENREDRKEEKCMHLPPAARWQ